MVDLSIAMLVHQRVGVETSGCERPFCVKISMVNRKHCIVLDPNILI